MPIQIFIFSLVLQTATGTDLDQVFAGTQKDSSKDTRSRSAYFQSHLNHYLQVPTFRSVFVCNDMECLRECLRETNCFSFNLDVNSDQRKNLRLCELLAATQYYAHESFIPQPSFHHFSVQVSPAQFEN